MRIKSFLFTCLVICATGLYAQGKGRPNTDKVSPADFNLPASPAIDSNANAVVLFDIGKVHFEGNKDGLWVSYVFERHARIKVLNKKAYAFATKNIVLYGEYPYHDRLSDFHASSFNIENGKIFETKLNTTDLFENRLNKYAIEKKFTFPGLKEGTIIDYSYKITSHRYYSVPAWSFQYLDYPCLYSEYEMHIPGYLRFVVGRQGLDSFYSNTAKEGFDVFYVGENTGTPVQFHSVVNIRNWVMKNIPGFNSESYMYFPEDYLDKISFYLPEVNDNSQKRGLTSWKSVNWELLSDKYFGRVFEQENTNELQETVNAIITRSPGQMEAARQIYQYVRDNFTTTTDNEIYAGHDLYTINKIHQGSVAEINLLLIAFLKLAGLSADPVILSTRDHGIHPANYPLLDRMNYVICQLKTNANSYFLDASNKNIGFGKLPINCYNGHARVISNYDSADVYFNPDEIDEKKITTVFLGEDGDRYMSAYIQESPGYFESTGIRNDILKNGEEEFFKHLKEGFQSEVEITNTGIDSVHNLDIPLKIHYELELKAISRTEIIYFTPVLLHSFKTNPLIAEERKYPMEFDYPLDHIYVLNMPIPTGYIVDEMPKSEKLIYNGNEGFYEYLIQKDENNIQLRCHLKLNRADYSPDEYKLLRDFFGFVVKKESELITFKKKK